MLPRYPELTRLGYLHLDQLPWMRKIQADLVDGLQRGDLADISGQTRSLKRR